MLAAISVSAINFADGDRLTTSASTTATLLQEPAYSGVGSVEITEGNARFRGTGVLVASNWVLTAAHNWDASAVTDLSFNWNGQTYAANPFAWQQHPGWFVSPEVGLTQGWDFGLFQLSEPVSGATPASLYTGSLSLGSELTFFGAGLTGTGGSLQANPDATLYAGTNTLDRILAMDGPYGPGGLLAFDFDDGTNSHNSLANAGIADIDGNFVATMPGVSVIGHSSSLSATSLEGTSALGDSGGPAFVDTGNGPELVGLISWGVNPTNPANRYGSDLGDITYITDLTHHHDWINSSIPEPQISALVIGGLAIFIASFRRMRIAE